MDDVADKPQRPRKRSPRSIVNRAAISAAQASGKMPHEILLDIARGTPLIQSRIEWDEAAQVFKPAAPVVLIPDLQMRMAAARDSAPYYAPKLSALELLQGMSDDELNEAIGVFAAEAGIGIAAAGGGAAPEEPAAQPRRADPPADRPADDESGDSGGTPAS